MEKKGVFSKIGTFFREVREESGKVSWPTRKEVFRYAIIVVVVSVMVATILGSFDYILVKVLY
jgi:preprotein translocase subunit SecE